MLLAFWAAVGIIANGASTTQATEAPTTAPTTAAPTTAAPTAEAMQVVEVSFVVQGLDFNALSYQNKYDIKQSVATTIASETTSVTADDVDVVLSAGSVNVQAKTSATNAAAANAIASEITTEATTLASSMTTSVSGLSGMPTTGAISVTTIQAEVAEAPDSAAQIASLVLKFQNMQAQVDQFTTDVQVLESSIDEVESAANTTGKGVLQVEKDIKDIASKAQFNKNETVKLKATAAEAVSEVEAATRKTRKLQVALDGLEHAASDMANTSDEVGGNAAELQARVKELLPDSDGVQLRINASEAILKMHQQEVDNGSVDKSIVTILNRTFARATLRVQKLAATIRQKQVAR
jgi:chromosome segregation ATPase